MLVLSRGLEDKILFPNLNITIEILRVSGNRVRIGIDAPQDVRVLRHELADQLPPNEAGGDLPSAHRCRNELNKAHLALGLVERQINEGQGTTALPALREAMAVLDKLDKASNLDDHEKKTPANKERPRVLLVEDDPNESGLLAGYLALSGFRVDTAEDGLQAMVHLGRYTPPDVVLLDMNMPNMSGPQTVNTIRQSPDLRDIQLFAVTGDAAETSPVVVGPEGVNRWFRKPIRPQELVDTMQEVLQDSA